MIEGIKKGLRKEQKEKQADESAQEAPEKEVVFGDGERPIIVPGIITQKEKTSDGWLVYGIRGKTHPKVVEVKICKNKREARRQKRKLHNAGNNKRRMNGKSLKRFIAKEKAENRCPIRTQ